MPIATRHARVAAIALLAGVTTAGGTALGAASTTEPEPEPVATRFAELLDRTPSASLADDSAMLWYVDMDRVWAANADIVTAMIEDGGVDPVSEVSYAEVFPDATVTADGALVRIAIDGAGHFALPVRIIQTQPLLRCADGRDGSVSMAVMIHTRTGATRSSTGRV